MTTADQLLQKKAELTAQADEFVAKLGEVRKQIAALDVVLALYGPPEGSLPWVHLSLPDRVLSIFRSRQNEWLSVREVFNLLVEQGVKHTGNLAIAVSTTCARLHARRKIVLSPSHKPKHYMLAPELEEDLPGVKEPPTPSPS